MPWKQTKKGWVRSDKGKNTLGGTSKSDAKKTNDKIDKYTDWWKKTPLERAKALEDK